MTVFKRILKIGIIVFGIILFFKILGMVLFKSHEDKPTELINFEPTENLKVQTSKPIFYYSNKELFYSENGEINLTKPIWKGEINERYYDNKVFVSPNSKYIAFDNNGSIKILTQNGDELINIKPVAKSMVDGRKSGKYWNSDFQWSENSENLYLMNDRVWEGSFNGLKNKTTLFKFSVKDKKIIKVIDLKEQSRNFYLDINQTNLYYTAYDSIGDNWLLKKLNLKTKRVIDTLKREKNWKIISNDSIFINFKTAPGDLKFGKRIGRSENDTLCNVYLIENDIEKLILKGKCGFDAFKGRKLGFLEQNLEIFLPNNRFYITEIYAKNHSGTIIIDTKTLEYKVYKKQIKPYFSNYKINYNDTKYTWGEFIQDFNIIEK
jgi:hypothetical protein